MGVIYAIRRKIRLNARELKKSFLKTFAPTVWKETNELSFWEKLRNVEGGFSNNHYEHFYTKHFSRQKSFYKDKVLLDIGCGPLGSLEWASNAKRRMGVDPLSNEYLKLGAAEHQMEYINAPSEKIPLNNEFCDVVFSFNSLDHVENIEKTIKEIKRVVKSKGYFFLIVEINHPPRDCEPHSLDANRLISSLKPEFICEDLRVYKPVKKGIYASIRENVLFSDPMTTREEGILSAVFIKN